MDSFYFGKCIPLMESKGIPHIESSISWTDGAEIGIDLYPDMLVVGYSVKGESGREEIGDVFRFTGVRNNYGGADRIYFTCPYCKKRARYLYMHKRHFKCRTCARLNYRSQQTSKGWEMAVYRINKFLKDHFNITDLAPYQTEKVSPPRPKGMHEKTYAI